MACPSCGAEHDPAGGGFCEACGMWVGRAAPARKVAPGVADEDEGRPCPECGVCGTGTSCRQCGARMRSTDQDDEAAAEARRRRILRERERAAAAAAAAADATPDAAATEVELGALPNDDAATTVPDAAPDRSLDGMLESTRSAEAAAPGPLDADAALAAAADAFAASAEAPPGAVAGTDRDAAIEAELTAYMIEAEQLAAEQLAAEQPAAEQPAAEQPAAEQPAADADEVEVVFAPVPRDE